MNNPATTSLWKSLSESRAPSWVVSVNSGAGPFLERGAALLVASPVATVCQPSSPTATRPTRHQAPVCRTLPLQSLLQLIEKAPVGPLGDDRVRAALNDPRLVQAERVETDGVLGVVLPPFAVRDLLQGLQGVVVVVAPVGDPPGGALGLEGAEVGGLQDGPYRPLGGDGLLADELAMPRDHAAEVLRPRAIHAAVDHDVADLLRAERLRIGREPQEGVNLTFGQELHRLGRRVRRPIDVLVRVQAYVRHDAGEEHVLARAEPLHSDCFPLQIAHGADPLGPE